MLPRVGRRRGGAPVGTRRERELDEPRNGRFDRDHEPVATTPRDRDLADDRTATRGTLEDRR
jgi:hypothetical protein